MNYTVANIKCNSSHIVCSMNMNDTFSHAAFEKMCAVTFLSIEFKTSYFVDDLNLG